MDDDRPFAAVAGALVNDTAIGQPAPLSADERCTRSGTVAVVVTGSTDPDVPPPTQPISQVTVARTSYTPPGWPLDGAL
ncbi:hypothetical protein ACFYP0_14690 [Micromonospora arida]|uniref:hypothetical protein n=1 Tax=Micromonospora TaxID=1873 RepID=UPI00340BDC71